MQCYFHGCDSPPELKSLKCMAHMDHPTCRASNCRYHVLPQGAFCRQHAATAGVKLTQPTRPSKKPLCTVDGCDRQAKTKGKCTAHGGYRQCEVDHCTSHARQGGFCQRHGRLQEVDRTSPKKPQGPKIPNIKIPPYVAPSTTNSTPTSSEQSAETGGNTTPEPRIKDEPLDEPYELSSDAKAVFFSMTEPGAWMFKIQI
ncbi:Aste57867_4990 [Aphanomyces stellatus]|uniref:Aste57867_4990 protein n=1 Tax=Aphanomyces stellatus TaxID=120398 RepID=A0A485KH56_9STRA|nr:hypothetical protein As57867_004977 [Aphanomyces stellatus]VFT82076.1 Aste57867_4990 [Aphanomyces stellatus]